MSLGQALRILAVVLIRTAKNDLAVLLDLFRSYDGAPIVVLAQGKFVCPPVISVQHDSNLYVGLTSRRETSNLGKAMAFGDRPLEPATRLCNLLKKPEDIQKIGFPRSVRSHKKRPPGKPDVRLLEVSPVPESNRRGVH